MDKQFFHILDSFPSQEILVIGETMLDSYLKGSSDHLCHEAPVPVVEVDEHEQIPGGAANTAVNAATLGARVHLLSVIGDDIEGRVVTRLLKEHGVQTSGIFVSPGRRTLAKQRILADSQMVVRFDHGDKKGITSEAERFLIRKLEQLFPHCSGLIISDYNYGVLTPNVIDALARLQEQHPQIIVADSKCLTKFKPIGPTAVKPNYRQAMRLLNLDTTEGSTNRIEQVLRHGEEILEITGAQIAAVTLDSDGAFIFERGRPLYRTYAKSSQVHSTAGAGDTYTSALTLALAAGGATPTAAEIASAAADIVVHKDGTSTTFTDELRGYFSGGEKIIEDPFLLAARIAAYRHEGRKIVFTNGCFDILHRGHITYLNQAKDLGDVLIMGVNSDESVARLKGPSRPLNPLEDRIQVLAALSCVDHIVPFYEDRPDELIKLVRPDVFVKGGDYTRETLPEAPLVERLGGKVEILPYIKDKSTTGVIEKIKKQVTEIEGTAD
jgi:D-beta-D-heptose 7-phosphate kinase/D-beta-D-heptose 1-phosphate adenosyltransferase